MDNLGHNSRIAAYDPLKDLVAAAAATASTAAFDYTTKEGNREARSYLHNLRKLKAQIEETRKKEKADSLEYGRRVDEQAKALQAELAGIMTPHEKELERLEKLELERVGALRDRLAKLKQAGDYVSRNWATLDVTVMQQKLDELQADGYFDPAIWQEFFQEADSLGRVAIVEISKGLELKQEKLKNDAELAELREAQRVRDEQAAEEQRLRDAEAEIQRKEQAERDQLLQAQQAEQARQLAEANAAREAAEAATRAANERAAKAERDKQEADRRAEQAAEAERQRVQREQQAELERQEAERQRQECEVQKRQQAEREAEERRAHLVEQQAVISNEVRGALMNGAALSGDQASRVLSMLVNNEIPHVTLQWEE